MTDSARFAPIARSAWEKVHGRAASENEVAFVLAIADLETGFGRIGQFAKFAAQGKYNWGALETRAQGGSCPAGTLPGNDLGSVCFYVYDSDEAAAKAFIWNLTANPKFAARNAAVLAAMKTGDPTEVARAMRVQAPYYSGYPNQSEEQKIAYYASAIRSHMPSSLPVASYATGSALGTLLFLALAGGGLYVYKNELQRHLAKFFAIHA